MEYKDKKYTYLGGLMHGISTLATGMKTSIKVYFRKKVTEQYPENRKELKMFDRFRGTLNMPHNENNEHRCVACGLCQMACPNDTIKVTSETVETEDGKKKKILATYEYDLGACMFCQLCVNACPHDAITFDQNFEHAVFDRAKLVLKLNHDGSKVTSGEGDRAEKAKRSKVLAGLFTMIAGLAIILFITLKHDFMQTANLAPQEISIHAIGNALLSSDKYGYVLPFEAVSILLLACIIGGIMIARKR